MNGCDAHGRLRFIPTHAGNGASPTPVCSPPTVHPHARGERIFHLWSRSRRSGSSPRTRGTVRITRCSGPSERFIPTHAGNGRSCALRLARVAVHPHARGERGATGLNEFGSVGSSPRTRGTARNAASFGGVYRFIPTHAGNGPRGPSTAPRGPVHPHARGERGTARASARRGYGSSPRTRGTVSGLRRGGEFHRFIPTHAGNGPRSPAGRPGRTVHPHARGERRRGLSQSITVVGSSPRTRGTGVPVGWEHRLRRFIPTHAGNGLPEIT